MENKIKKSVIGNVKMEFDERDSGKIWIDGIEFTNIVSGVTFSFLPNDLNKDNRRLKLILEIFPANLTTELKKGIERIKIIDFDTDLKDENKDER